VLHCGACRRVTQCESCRIGFERLQSIERKPMATIITNVTDNLTLTAGASFNYWFRPHNNAWQAGTTIDKDRTTLYPIARPWLPGSWDIEGDEVTVLLEEDANATPLRYRHAYALLVKNWNTAQTRYFFIAATQLTP
jgi:hypothetical protein